VDSPTSADAQAVILVCTSIGTGRNDQSPRPFGPRTWAKLQSAMARRGLSPASLLGLDAKAIGETLETGEAEADRLAWLLGRGGQLAFELDRLGSRGLWVLTVVDEGYPSRLRERLTVDAPPVLFGAGNAAMLDLGGVAIVGARDADEPAIAFTEHLASTVASAGAQVVSGGARGVDAWATRAAFLAGGRVVGVLPEGVERRLREPDSRVAIAEGRAVLVSPYRPDAPFSAGAAMARNKLIYALADAAVVVSSAAESGGTWAGAIEALDAGWVPVFVRDAEDVPEGNRRLLGHGALPLSEASVDVKTVVSMLGMRPRGRVAEGPVEYRQASLFGD